MTIRSPSLTEFLDCAHREFHFLTTEYGFVETPNDVRRYYEPFSVRYENQTTLVIVAGIAHGFDTTVGLGVIPQPTGDLDHTLPLWPLAKLRQSEFYQVYRQTHGQLNQLPLLANLLRLSADDILHGDFAMIPFIKQAVDEYIAEQRQRYAERDFQTIMAQASASFWQKDYRNVVTLLEPWESKLPPVAATQLAYARRRLPTES